MFRVSAFNPQAQNDTKTSLKELPNQFLLYLKLKS